MTYRKKRYYTYLLSTVLSLTVPFITIGGNHLLLLSFDKKQLHLAGVAFDMQEFYILPFLLILLFVGIFALTTIGGRVWCGWACPQTILRVIYRDIIETLILKLRKIKNKQIEPDWSKKENISKRLIGISLWSIISLAAASNFMWYFVPPEDFFEYLKNPADHMFLIGIVLAIASFLIYDIVFLKEDFCTYVCPYSRIQSALYDDDTVQAIYSKNRGGEIYSAESEQIVFNRCDLNAEDECRTCNSCVKVCPNGIDIRKGEMQVECINCLECVDACTAVMTKHDRPPLVQWSSTNKVVFHKKSKLFRNKTASYATVLILVIGTLFVMGGKKESMLLNINKTTQLYKIKENNKVSNNYLLLFQNTQSTDHTFRLKILGKYADKIKIERFKELRLSRGKMAKKIVVLSTTEKLSNATDDTTLLLTIKAYSVDEPEKVFVTREIVFIYPGKNEFYEE